MSSLADSPLDRVKQALTIPTLGALLGCWETPSAGFARHRRSPFREDRHPSFSIYAEDRRWKDFGTNDGGDLVDFAAKALGLSLSDAARHLLALSSRSGLYKLGRHRLSTGTDRAATEVHTAVPSRYPAMVALSDNNQQRLIAQRQFPEKSLAAVQLLTERAHLLQCRYFGTECWAICDKQSGICQLRSLSGAHFRLRDGRTLKSFNLRGSRNGMVGRAQAYSARNWILAEGAPDWLAVTALRLPVLPPSQLSDTAFLCATSASIRLDLAGLASPHTVEIFAQNDRNGTGKQAAIRWQAQLKSYFPNCRVRCFMPSAPMDWAEYLQSTTGLHTAELRPAIMEF